MAFVGGGRESRWPKTEAIQTPATSPETQTPTRWALRILVHHRRGPSDTSLLTDGARQHDINRELVKRDDDFTPRGVEVCRDNGFRL